MTKKLFSLLLCLTLITARAEEPTVESSTPTKTWATAATQTVLGGCQTLAQIAMVSGAWKMITADDYTNVRYKWTPKNIDGVLLYLDCDTMTTKHTYIGQMFEGAAAIVVGYLIYKSSCLLEDKIVPKKSCGEHCDETCQKQPTELARETND